MRIRFRLSTLMLVAAAAVLMFVVSSPTLVLLVNIVGILVATAVLVLGPIAVGVWALVTYWGRDERDHP